MGGGLMQLVAYGAQDIYLTGNPQITFFKVVYRRHTNFSMESIEQTFNGTADFGKRVTCTISRNGDLISRVYLQVTLPEVSNEGCTSGTSCLSDREDPFRWVNYVGHHLIQNVEVEIGGQRIDRQYGDWLNIWNELTQEPGKQVGYDNMVGNTIALTGVGHNKTEATTLYVPLQFWFCRNPGLALPLIALQYHEVKINLEFSRKEELYVLACGKTADGCQKADCNNICVPSLEAASLYVDYIYLDTDERRRFAQVSHEYLIEQLQFTGDESVTNTNVKIKLNFNHPCKALFWVVQPNRNVLNNVNQWSNYTDWVDCDSCLTNCSDGNLHCRGLASNVEAGHMSKSFPYTANLAATSGCTLDPNCPGKQFTDGTSDLVREFPYPGTGNPGQLNSVNNLAPVNFSIYNEAADGMDHAGLGPRNAGRNPTVRAKLQLNGHDRFSARLGSYFNLVQPYQHFPNIPATGINVYSFALQPVEHQPSGTCNFSRIDNATLQLQLTNRAVTTDNSLEGVTDTNDGAKVRVYAVNYNVLRIMSGMGGLAYSN